jgi:HSP20 family molecular chaperone IbpA
MMTQPTKEGEAMAAETRNDIQKTESASLAARPEQTRSGPVYTPAVDIFENDNSITVLADMPGVKANDLKIDLRESVLTLTGRVSKSENSGVVDVLREYESGMFFRQFTLGETIEQSKIDAKLSDGVLRLELPKMERARPRQIAVRAE